MKKPAVLATLFLAAAACQLAAPPACAQTIDDMPPVVVKTLPEAGTTDVPPGPTEIRITFSKEMTDQSWSICEPWKGANPPVLEKAKYLVDAKTCTLKVQLEPNKTYAYWLNTSKFQAFKDAQGHPAVPYLLVFHTATTTRPAP